MKKILLSILFAALLTMSACNNNPEHISDTTNDSGINTDLPQSVETIPLNQDEISLLEAIGSDLEIISESNYADIVTEMIYHTDSYIGKVVQIEGIFSSNLNGDSIPYVYRTLTNNGDETICGLPLMYLEKDIPDDVWIRVSGIVNDGEVNGTTATVIEVVAIESLSEDGQKILEWTGSTHNH
jgi:uncharacterized membrane protein YcgQ (UPF0703/DUF1980 family)